jgi:hypothetical protein
MAQESYSLQNFQVDFAQAIITGEEPATLLKEIIPAGTLPDGSAALAVHRDGYYFRLTEALGETFEGCWYLLGDDDFFTLCRDYIEKNPSGSYNLSNYGEEFPLFISQHHFASEHPYLLDVARLDWAFMEIFHAPTHQPISLNILQQLSVEQLESSKVIFGSAVNLLTLDYSVLPLWKSRTLELLDDTDKDTLEPNQIINHLLLYKMEEQIYINQITSAQFNTLSLLMVGRMPGEVALLAEECSDQYDLSGIFQLIGTTGIVAGIEVNNI